MNWRRGFFRLWIAVSVLWITISVTFVTPLVVVPAFRTLSPVEEVELPDAPMSIEGFDWEKAQAIAAEMLAERQAGQQQRAIALSGAVIAAPPVGLLLIGMAVGWIFGGFRRKDAEGPGSNDGR